LTITLDLGLIMPRFFEVDTDTDVLCYIPSGKITDTGQQEIQFFSKIRTLVFNGIAPEYCVTVKI